VPNVLILCQKHDCVLIIGKYENEIFFLYRRNMALTFTKCYRNVIERGEWTQYDTCFCVGKAVARLTMNNWQTVKAQEVQKRQEPFQRWNTLGHWLAYALLSENINT